MSPMLPDLLAKNLSAVFCGTNPGLRSAALGHHFATRSNRFWTVLHLAGFTPVRIEPEHSSVILRYGYGLTTVVERPTARADQVAKHEFVAAAHRLEFKIERYAPRYVAFLGKVAYSTIAGRQNVEWGPQPALLGGVPVWVLPNPSGLNRAFRLEDLVRAYREFREQL